MLSDGSEYIFYSKDNQQIFKDVTVNNVGFTVIRLHERVLNNPEVKHTYTVTAGSNNHEYASVTLDSNLDKVASYVAGDLQFGEAEQVIPNFPHDVLIREEEPQITFGMFVEAAKTDNIFDFNHPEILKILGETPSDTCLKEDIPSA